MRGGMARTGNVITTTIKNTVRAPRIRKVSLVDKIVTCCSTTWLKAGRLPGARRRPSGINGGGYCGSTPLLWITRQRTWPASSTMRSECSALRPRSTNATNQPGLPAAREPHEDHEPAARGLGDVPGRIQQRRRERAVRRAGHGVGGIHQQWHDHHRLTDRLKQLP